MERLRRYDIEKTYLIKEVMLLGTGAIFSFSNEGCVDEMLVPYERMDWGGRRCRCIKDHVNKVIYVDTYAREADVEKSSG
jgi:hypothetical protein